jgi:hypothetical protein
MLALGDGDLEAATRAAIQLRRPTGAERHTSGTSAVLGSKQTDGNELVEMECRRRSADADRVGGRVATDRLAVTRDVTI